LRRREADAFYHAITPVGVSEDAANVMRQALAGMLWSKQYYFFDLAKWLAERGAGPTQVGHVATRNREWEHMVNDAVISMPDKCEYPWFAAWDLAFHTSDAPAVNRASPTGAWCRRDSVTVFLIARQAIAGARKVEVTGKVTEKVSGLSSPRLKRRPPRQPVLQTKPPGNLHRVKTGV
jgi:hypothetical protein